MKSFADWLDDNVERTREVLAKRAPAPRTEEATELPAAPQPNAVTPVGWVDDLTAQGATRLSTLRQRISASISGPFPVGHYIRLVDRTKASVSSAQDGALARVLGYIAPLGGRVVVCVEWSDDARRARLGKTAGDGAGQQHGFYYADGFAMF